MAKIFEIMITIITTHSFDNFKEVESERWKKLLSRIWILYLASRLRFMDENFHLNFFIYISNISYMINFPLTSFASSRCCSTTNTTSDEFNYFSLVSLSRMMARNSGALSGPHLFAPLIAHYSFESRTLQCDIATIKMSMRKKTSQHPEEP